MEKPSDHLKLMDVAVYLQSRYAILSGGKAKNGAPVITFPSRLGQPEVADEDYAKVVSYLCSIFPMHESEGGVVVVIDRQQDGWGAVKSILLKLSSFFPVHIQVVFLLQPKGFFQRAFADFRTKFLKEDLEFKVVLCDDHKEMEDYVHISQLTVDVGGDLEFDALEWTEHRSAVEKFAKNTVNISKSLTATVTKMKEREIPNAIDETEAMLGICLAERNEMLEDISSAVTHCNTLLKCIKGEEERTPLTKVCHVLELERLLLQLEESERGFGEFWSQYETRLKQSLSFRQFEEEFKLLQFSMGVRVDTLQQQMTELGSSVADVETLLQDFESMENKAQTDLDQCDRMRSRGEQLMVEGHHARDSIWPKCLELQRMCEHYKEMLRNRRDKLSKSHDLHDRLERANKWCSSGLDLLASQPMEGQQTAEVALAASQDVQTFLETARDLKLSNPKEFRLLFEDILTQDHRVTVQKTVQRLEDVKKMCETRIDTLQKIFDPKGQTSKLRNGNQSSRVPRDRSRHRQSPPEESSPAPAAETKRPPVSLAKSARYRQEQCNNNNNNTISSNSRDEKCPKDLSPPDQSSDASLSDRQPGDFQDSSVSSMSLSFAQNGNDLDTKRMRVLTELIDTEVTYVNEMHQILQGYYHVMEHKSQTMMIPPLLLEHRHTLFGNLPEIHCFHKDIFLQELKNCKDDPSKVGRCFIRRKEEFQMYSIYCQNKLRSEELWKSIGDSNAFLKDCQKKLGHRLPLGAYLLKPIQRITKYQLLLKEMLRFANSRETSSAIQEALDTMLCVLAYLNDSMHQVNIQGFNESLADQGRLVLHGAFRVWTEHKHDRIRDLRLRSMQRHVFLFQKSVLLCKRKEENNSEDPSYILKKHLKLSQVGLTEKIKGDKRKFELWLRGREEVYIIQAPDLETKALWVTEVKKVLLSQFDLLKENQRPPEVSANDSFTSRNDSVISQISSSCSSDMSFETGRPGDMNNHSTVPIGLEMTSPLSPFQPTEEDTDNEEEENQGWSSEFSDDEVADQHIPVLEPSYRERFTSNREYRVMDPTELALREGDTVEVMRVGKNGWWYAHHLRTDQEGWVPSSCLDRSSRPSSFLYSSSDSIPGLSVTGSLCHSRGPSPVPETTV